ncbi:hypothetical protein LEP1GSC019_1435 [Leptospira interrogans serovar Pyrogenes str. 2006006960]|nr:hypothetical protein LEP1GSC019_1435 [Leptospira interrogans serovar Pyrogenes str. 2006006960]
MQQYLNRIPRYSEKKKTILDYYVATWEMGGSDRFDLTVFESKIIESFVLKPK